MQRSALGTLLAAACLDARNVAAQPCDEVALLAGQSLGAMCGMPVFAYEPAIRAAVFNVPAAAGRSVLLPRPPRQ